MESTTRSRYRDPAEYPIASKIKTKGVTRYSYRPTQAPATSIGELEYRLLSHLEYTHRPATLDGGGGTRFSL